MNQHHLVASVLLILAFSAVATAQKNFSTLDAFKESVGGGKDSITVEATGDLNGDNLEDWAGVVHREKRDASRTYQLYVLLRQTQGSYQVAQTSREELLGRRPANQSRQYPHSEQCQDRCDNGSGETSIQTLQSLRLQWTGSVPPAVAGGSMISVGYCY